jgi:tetratricopeptide (TPR) repeat protein
MLTPDMSSTLSTNTSHSASSLIELADASFQAGRTAEAMHAYERLLQQEPTHAHALHRMGIACVRENQYERARHYLDAALTAAPDRADIWEHRGLLAVLDDERIAAEAFYHRALTLAGSTASLHRNLADCLKLSGRLAEARLHYAKALELDPGLHHAARALAKICEQMAEHSAAADYWQQACLLDNSHGSDAQALLAALSTAGRATEIDALLTRLCARYAADVPALESLAIALNGIHRFNDAIHVAQHGIDVDPRNAALHHNASYSCNMLGKFAQMHWHTSEAARLSPDHPRMQFNLAATLLRRGDFRQGWKQFGWNEALPENHDLVRPEYPEWKGQPVAGSRFLLIGEQGLGDQLQFLRMADWLSRQGAIVDVWVDVPLGEIAGTATGVHAAWTKYPRASYDYWCRMMRMPEYMQLAESMLPIATSYLKADAAKVAHWRARLDAMTGCGVESGVKDGAIGLRKKRIGLVWAGNPAYGLDRYRSIPLPRLHRLFELPHVSWLSLQMGAAQDDVKALPSPVDMQMAGSEIESFSDTLAIIQSLDLVITVDTAVAHLAGAAGKPVWILLPTCTDWRWMMDRTDSPWYPSVRLFRQRELDCWEPVVDDVLAALREFVNTPVA